MTGVLRSLIWKEFHELKWKAAALVAVAVGAPLVVLLHESNRNAAIASTISLLRFSFFPLAGIFVAMGVAGAEPSRKTLSFLRGLPVPRWMIMAVKLAMGAAACLAPILAVYLLDVFVLDQHLYGPPSWMASSGLTLSVYLWTVAAGIGRPDEWRVGVAGCIACLSWALYGNVASWVLGPTYPVAWYPTPLGFLVVHPTHWIQFAAAQVPIVSVLVLWSLWRFGRVPAWRARARSAELVGAQSGWDVARPVPRTRLGALAWLEWRQLGALCLTAVLSIPATTVLMFASAFSRRPLEQLLTSSMAGRAIEVLGGWTHFLGVFVAVLAAAAAFSGDLQPKITAFWRSRPISAREWFLVKYLIGVFIVLATLSIPLVFCSIAASFVRNLSHYPYALLLLVGPPLHILTFTVATCLICVSRRTFYSGLQASLLAFALIFIPQQFEALRWMQFNRMILDVREFRFDLAKYVAYAGTLLGLAVPAFGVAWLVVTRRLR